jgi:hypothetical protein
MIPKSVPASFEGVWVKKYFSNSRNDLPEFDQIISLNTNDQNH